MSKRKSDTFHEAPDPPAKRLRHAELPPLPPITAELERYVFTHPGAASQQEANPVHYDRLEWLGDAWLQIVATNLVYDTYPTATAGRLSQIRQILIQNETLSQYSQLYGLDKRLKIHRLENQDKKALTKIYGDVFEAYLGAICRSDPLKGPAQAEAWLKNLWSPRWEELLVKFPPEIIGQKEALAKKVLVPGVRLDYVDEKKPTIHKGKGTETYYVGVYMTGWGFTNQHLGSAKGTSKIQAGQAAAMIALENKTWMDLLVEKKAQYVLDKKALSEALDATADEKGVKEES